MTDTSKDPSAFDVQVLLDKAVEAANRKLEAAATAEAVLMHTQRMAALIDPSVRIDPETVRVLALNGIIPAVAAGHVKPLAELPDARNGDGHLEVMRRALETGQLPIGQFEHFKFGDDRSGQKEMK